MSYQFRFGYDVTNWAGTNPPDVYTTKSASSGTNEVAVGDLIVVAVPYRTTGADATITIIDSLGNPFVEMVGPRFFSTQDGNAGAKFFYAIANTPGVSTLTANYSFAVNSTGIFACVYSGFKASPVGPFAGFARLTSTGTTDGDVSNPINVSVPPVMQVGFYFAASASNGARYTAGTGFNDRLTGLKPNGEADIIKFIDGRVTSITANATAKMSGSPDANGGVGLFATFSFLEDNVDPLIVGVSDEAPRHQGILTISGQNFGSTQGASTVTIGGAPQNVTAWAVGSITVDVDCANNKFGIPIELRVTVGGIATTYTLTRLQPEAGWSFVDITSLANSADRIKTLGDLSIANQIAYTNGIVFPDATFAVRQAAGQTTTILSARVWNGTVWGLVGTETVTSTVSPGSSTVAGTSTAVGIGASQTATVGTGSAAGVSTAVAVGGAIGKAVGVSAATATSSAVSSSIAAGTGTIAASSTATASGLDRTQKLNIDLPFTQSSYDIDDDGFITLDADVAYIYLDAEVTYAL